MRASLLILSMGLLLVVGFCFALRPFDHRASARPSAASQTTSTPGFDKDIKPILQARCQPCHFQGGQVYEKLPFDKAETITRLGTKLFTRIKDEKERRLIQGFLDASKDSK